MIRFLVAGLGNIGDEYARTRHNVGFLVADFLASQHNAPFELKRYAYITRFRVKNKIIFVIKPTTFMNKSGDAVRYWLQQLNLYSENLLVISDDINLPVGQIRFRTTGSDGGHNGLAHIIYSLGTPGFNRMRIGIGNNFPKGQQVNYVLSEFTPDEFQIIEKNLSLYSDAIKCFALEGIQSAMNKYNKRNI